mmetsp:Transcript_293/g.804  ORF Transcript_293/g.804 Transcript_293/m.804 type:complete len:172 (+) Transcript_293:780-1295(+)
MLKTSDEEAPLLEPAAGSPKIQPRRRRALAAVFAAVTLVAGLGAVVASNNQGTDASSTTNLALCKNAPCVLPLGSYTDSCHDCSWESNKLECKCLRSGCPYTKEYSYSINGHGSYRKYCPPDNNVKTTLDTSKCGAQQYFFGLATHRGTFAVRDVERVHGEKEADLVCYNT